MSIVLGQGTYGEVTIRDNKAVKKFSKLSHLIQEYMALQYLDDCSYIVHAKGVDFPNLELSMELYDCSLRKWLEEQRANGGPNRSDILKIIHDILMGLVELHDRDLAHGDLKPGNVLVKKNPLRAVLGDCGFVSIAKYAKVDRTASIYRDPIVSHEPSHDMFSFGICFLEMIANIRINYQASYGELKKLVKDLITNPEYREIIYNLVHPEKSRRPTARSLLHRLFNENPPKWYRPLTTLSAIKYTHRGASMEPSPFITSLSVPQDDIKYIRRLMKKTGYQFKLNRAKKGYGALLAYIDNNNIEPSLYNIYTGVTLMILSAIFGRSGFRQEQVIDLCNNRYDYRFMYSVLEELLSDTVFINILLSPPQ